MVISDGTEDCYIMCTVIHYLPFLCLGEAMGAHRYLPPILVGHACFQ